MRERLIEEEKTQLFVCNSLLSILGKLLGDRCSCQSQALCDFADRKKLLERKKAELKKKKINNMVFVEERKQT